MIKNDFSFKIMNNPRDFVIKMQVNTKYFATVLLRLTVSAMKFSVLKDLPAAPALEIVF